MPACTSISKKLSWVAPLLLLLGVSSPAWAADNSKDKTLQPEEEDFSNTPFTEYGAFNEDADEEADTRFFQTGRFFGVSLGLGFDFVDGGRGQLYQGGFPVVDFKVHYWFDFNLALDLGFNTATHYFETTEKLGTHWDVNLFRIGVDLKYYFDTKDLSAPISFANPYVLAGGGQMSKSQHSESINVTENENAFCFTLGAGLEFAIKPKKAYFEIEGKANFVNFKDTSTTNFQDQGIESLDGRFYTLTGNFLFTW